MAPRRRGDPHTGPFTVYHSQLRTPNGRYDGPQQDRALIITYQRDIDREALVDATRDQWQAQGILQQEPRARSCACCRGSGRTSRRAASWRSWSAAARAVLVPRQRHSRLYPARPAPVGGVQHPLSRHLARSTHHLSRTASAVDQYTMKRILTLGTALLMLMLAGCSTGSPNTGSSSPPSTSFTIFRGRTEAWGMVQDRNGKQLRRPC